MHKYGISLNPKKSFFSMREGKLLVHIVSKEGVKLIPKESNPSIQLDYLEIRKKYNPSWEDNFFKKVYSQFC
jgi:CRISPR/Cas system-associated protein Cas5 (RAMP superfamily)